MLNHTLIQNWSLIPTKYLFNLNCSVLVQLITLSLTFKNILNGKNAWSHIPMGLGTESILKTCMEKIEVKLHWEMGALNKIIFKYAESISPYSKYYSTMQKCIKLSLSLPSDFPTKTKNILESLSSLYRQDRKNKKTISRYCPFQKIEYLLTSLRI